MKKNKNDKCYTHITIEEETPVHYQTHGVRLPGLYCQVVKI